MVSRGTLGGERQVRGVHVANVDGITAEQLFYTDDRAGGSSFRLCAGRQTRFAIGRMAIVSTGINCYLSSHDRLMLDGGMARISDRVDDGDFYFIQVRLQIEL